MRLLRSLSIVLASIILVIVLILVWRNNRAEVTDEQPQASAQQLGRNGRVAHGRNAWTAQKQTASREGAGLRRSRQA